MGAFGYGVGPAAPGADAETGEPVKCITVQFQDTENSDDIIQVIIGETAARDLAMKMLDQLKKGSVDTFGTDALRRLDGRP